MVGKEILVPPLSFAMVEDSVYRSGYPNKRNFPFLKKLGLRSIMYLSDDEYSQENLDFLKEHNINIFHIRISGNKEPFQEIDQADVVTALQLLLDTRNHPMLVHCNKGRHRVGCIVGCLRKLQSWSMASLFDEFRRFCGSNKMQIADQEFIEVFDSEVQYDLKYAPDWI